MTTSGEPPLGAGDASEPDWIDQILERATSEVEARRAAAAQAPPAEPAPPSAVPPAVLPAAIAAEPAAVVEAAVAVQPAVAPEPVVTVPSAAVVPPLAEQVPATAAEPLVRRAPASSEELAAIEWVDSTNVTPASTPIVSADTALTAGAIGRSAWDDELASVGDTEPDGWDQLSWQDLDEAQSIEHRPLQEQTSFGRLLREWGPVLFAAIAIALFTRLVLVQAYHIPSESMLPTLEDGDRVVVNRLSYQFGEVERGQVVVFAKPRGAEGENDLIKRVIGLPGETIRFVDNQVYINGLRVEELYLASQESTRPRLSIPGCAQVETASDLCVIPDDHVFVMGDNRLGSSDSRVFGPVDIDSIVGRAFLRVWPLNHTGQL